MQQSGWLANAFPHPLHTYSKRNSEGAKASVKIFLSDTEVAHSQLLSAPSPQGEGWVFHLGIKQGFI